MRFTWETKLRDGKPMSESYDFSKAQKNPYAKKLKGKRIIVQPDVSLTIKDILQANPQKKIESEYQKLWFK